MKERKIRGVLCPDQSLTLDDIFALYYAGLFCKAKGQEMKIVRCDEPYPSEEKVMKLLAEVGVTMYETGRPVLRPLYVGVGKEGIHNGTGKYTSLIMLADQLTAIGSIDTEVFLMLTDLGSSQNRTGKLKQGYGIPYILRHAAFAGVGVDMDEVIRRAIQVVELWVADSRGYFKPTYSMNRMEECSDAQRIFDELTMQDQNKGKAQLRDIQPLSMVWLADRACGMARKVNDNGDVVEHHFTVEEANELVVFWYELSKKVVTCLNSAEEGLAKNKLEVADFEFPDTTKKVARFFSKYGHWEGLAWTRIASRSEKPRVDLMVSYDHTIGGFLIATSNIQKGGKMDGLKLAAYLNNREGVKVGEPPVWICIEGEKGDRVFSAPYKFSNPKKSKLVGASGNGKNPLEMICDWLFEYSQRNAYARITKKASK